MPTTPPEASSSTAAGKAKQTRRRQRLSCVECTRRRQKCDRQIPCGLCVSRGIPHLCRWEPIVARPSPQRPPDGAPTTSQQSTITALTARIALLEETIQRQNELLSPNSSHRRSTPPSSPSFNGDSVLPDNWRVVDSFDDIDPTESHSGPTLYTCPQDPPSDGDNDTPYETDIQLAAVKMAQLTIAPSNEYIGIGTIICAIHKLGNINMPRHPHTGSGAAPLNTALQPGNNPLSEHLRQLISALPPRHVFEALVDAYFTGRNWMFGIPERWFRRSCQQMWAHLDLRCPGEACHASGGCPRCTREINPHWLLLCFSVLMLAPRRDIGTTGRGYFWSAMETRRLIEDVMLCSPAYLCAPTQSVMHGVTLSCMATALYTCYLADNGRISDAWKLVGIQMRTAQAVGLHRDPNWVKWETIDKTERELRLLGWWFLCASDRIYSLVLGRPSMASSTSFDVRMVPGEHHGDGTENPNSSYQQCFIVLMELLEETVTKCLGVNTPPYSTALEVEAKYQRWFSKVDPQINWRIPRPPSDNHSWKERCLAYQRHTCAAYWLGGLLNLHRPYALMPPEAFAASNPSSSRSSPTTSRPKRMTKSRSTSPSDAAAAEAEEDSEGAPIVNPSRERCIELAMELVQVLCDAQDEAALLELAPQVPSVIFHYCYFVFDGAVALASGLVTDPPHPRARELLKSINRAITMLENARDANIGFVEGEAGTASRGITILDALRKSGRWDEKFGDNTSCSNGTTSAGPGPSSGASGTTTTARTFGFAMPYGGNASIPADPSHFVADLDPQGSASFLGMSPGPSAFPGGYTPSGMGHTPTASSTAAPATPLPQSSYMGPDGFSFGAFGMGGPVSENFGAQGQRVAAGMPTQAVNPFDMLQHSDNFDIDWGALMGPAPWSPNPDNSVYMAGGESG